MIAVPTKRETPMPPTPRPKPSADGAAGHWDTVYTDRDPSEVSWFQPTPTVSLELVEGLGLHPSAPILDVGAGASRLLDALLERRYRDVTALDVSARALTATRDRPAVAAGIADGRAHTIEVDLQAWAPPRRYACWHDRAVFHFLTDPEDRARYRAVAVDTVAAGGHLVVGTFAAQGPPRCSGLVTARYTPEQLAAALAPEFVPERTRHEVHRTPAGVVQPFTWLVLRKGLTAEPNHPGPGSIRQVSGVSGRRRAVRADRHG